MPITFTRRRIVSSLVGLSLSMSSVASQDDFFNLSLEQLSDLRVSTGQLVDVLVKDSPSALTVISKDHIERSPAKNLAELLEIYVPGLMLMAHSEGDKIGIRGNIAAENYKLLILVNGKDITNMVYEGVITEIDQWNMDDIEKVEVVRGPGSVVYGAGAIAGIINIITKRPDIGMSQISFAKNFDYQSAGFSFQTSNKIGDMDAYFFGSYRETGGLQNPRYYLTNGDLSDNNRYLGLGDGDLYGPQPYLGDSFDRAQIKLHMDIDVSDELSVFARYTQSGQTHHFRRQTPNIDTSGNVLSVDDNRKVSIRSFIIAPEFNYKLDENASIDASLTYDTQEYIRYEQLNPDYPEKHPFNIREYAFSQNRWVASAIYGYQTEDWNVSAGYEFRATNIGAPWGKSENHLMVREGDYLISNYDDSVYTKDNDVVDRVREIDQDDVIEIGNGLDFYTHSLLLEANKNLSDKIRIHYGSRLDFPDVSSTMFSPRLALITNPQEDMTFTTTIQRALRMLPLRAQFIVDEFDQETEKDHEKIDSIEFSVRKDLDRRDYLNARLFYNDIDAIGYTGRELRFLGNLKLAGLEVEAAYELGGFELLMNHSFIKNIDHEMNEELKASGTSRNNISYSDYNYIVDRNNLAIPLQSYGDGINNWSDNTTKLILTKRFWDDELILQLNTQIFWDYNGSYDEMHMYQVAYDNYDTSGLTPAQLADFQQARDEFNNERRLLEEQNAYERQINVGASATYINKLPNNERLELSLYLQNLLETRKRYYVNTGSSRTYPNRLNFMKEPTVVSLGVKYTF